MLDLGDEDERRPTIADVPGLIEGASLGAGLGHAFLRHVERTRILVHVVDGSDRDPEWAHGVIRDELEAHDPALLAKPMIVAFNKIDRPAAEAAWPAFRDARRRDGLPCVAISAATGTGIAELRALLAERLPGRRRARPARRTRRSRRPSDRIARRRFRRGARSRTGRSG